MKIGIFGDSYADPVHSSRESWPTILMDRYDVTVHAASGTSMWWAREQFMQYYKDYDTIIFSFTSQNRWPALPDHLTGRHWNIGYKHNDRSDDFLDEINPYYFELFPAKFSAYINSQIHREIVEVCENEGKYLINVIPFVEVGPKNTPTNSKHDFSVHPNQFPSITGLDAVSHKEQIELDGEMIGIGKLLCGDTTVPPKYELSEARGCHLSPANNRIVADWMIDCIDNNKYNEYFNGEEYMNWVICDPKHTENFLKLRLRPYHVN